jgi:hypothetical protein
MKKYGILSFKGTVKEFRVFLQGMKKDLDEGMPNQLPSTIKVKQGA